MTVPFVGTNKDATTESASTVFGSIFGYSSYGGTTAQYYNSNNYKSYYIPNSLTEVTVLGGKLWHGAFYNCKNLTKITLGEDVEIIGEKAFFNCGNIESLDLYNVYSIGDDAFSNMKSLHTINIFSSGAPILSSVNTFNDLCIIYVDANAYDTYMNDVSWTSHQSQIIPRGTKTDYDVTVTASLNKSALHMKIGEMNLQNVVSLKVSGSINSYDLMLMRNKMVNLRHLDLSDAFIESNSYEYYNNEGVGFCSVVNTLTQYALQPRLLSVKLPNSLTAINDCSLQELTHIKELEIPASVQTIGAYAAKGLSNLQSLKFAEDSQLKTIDSYAFYDCSSIDELSIPGSVTYMSGNAIMECSSLEKFILEDGNENLTLTGYYYINPQCPFKCVYIGRNIISDYDLGQNASIFVIRFYNEESLLSNVVIGPCVTSLPNRLFYNSKCSSVTIPSSLATIGTDAFLYNQTNEIHIEDVNAWCNISGLSTLMESNYAKDIYLNGEKLESVDLAGIESVPEYAFAHATISNVNIPANSTIAEIPDYAFAYTNINKLQMPVSVKKIGDYAFYNCAEMTEAKLPSAINLIGNHAFDGCPKLNDVYTYTIEPQQIDQYTFSTYTSATLHVPHVSFYNYFYNTQWSQFLKLVDFDEPYDYIFIDQDLTIDENTGAIEGEPDTDINAGGGLIVEDNIVQDLGDVHIKFNGTTNIGASIIGTNIHANKIYLDLDVKADYWYYFCFPFSVDLKTVQKSGGYVFRYYDGAERAKGNSGWKNLSAGTDHLEAGVGYIFRTNEAGVLSICIDKQTIEQSDVNTDAITSLNSYTAETTDNKSWNFVGNRYISYYDINDLAYDAPIVIWDGTQYVALRPGDDDWVLYPFEAFFVQKPENVKGVGFDADAKETYIQSQEAAKSSAKRRVRAAKRNADRRLINLTLSDGNSTDKARVVFNDKQMLSYETECDATKFAITAGLPQMYTIDDEGIKYSINERPVSDGKVMIGFVVPRDGEYTIGVTRMDAHVFLEDAVTGTVHDLAEGEYSFASEAGSFASRFTLVLADDEATAIAMLNGTQTSGTNISNGTYDINGRRVENAKGVVIKSGKKVYVK